jgi:hypothetical protein
VIDGMRLAELSTLYRYSTLARALNISPREMLALIALRADHPFDPTPAIAGAPARTAVENVIRFVERVKRIQASPFVILELDYLLRHQAMEASPYAPSDEELKGLREIRGVLKKAQEDHRVLPDPTGERTKQKLSILLPPEEVEAAMAILAAALP